MDTRIWTRGGMRRLVVPVLLIVLLLVVVAAGTAAARAPQRASAPTIDSITPTTAPNTGPVAINVTGTGFATRARLTAKLVSGGITLTGSAQATRDFLARAHFDLTGVAAGTYSVVIANPDGQQATLPAAFVVTAGAQPKPAITKLKPTSGKRKATVTITGTGFGAARAGDQLRQVRRQEVRDVHVVEFHDHQVQGAEEGRVRSRQGLRHHRGRREQHQELHGQEIGAAKNANGAAATKSPAAFPE